MNLIGHLMVPGGNLLIWSVLMMYWNCINDQVATEKNSAHHLIKTMKPFVPTEHLHTTQKYEWVDQIYMKRLYCDKRHYQILYWLIISQNQQSLQQGCIKLEFEKGKQHES